MAKSSGGAGRTANVSQAKGGSSPASKGGLKTGGVATASAANATTQITRVGDEYEVVVRTLQGKVQKFTTRSVDKARSRAKRLAGG